MSAVSLLRSFLLGRSYARGSVGLGNGDLFHEREAGFAAEVHGVLDGGGVSVSMFEGIGAATDEEVDDFEGVGGSGCVALALVRDFDGEK